MMQAAMKNDIQQVMELAHKESNINARDEDARTALHWAASCGGTETLEWLLSRSDIQIDTQDEAGWTPLMSAASAGHIDCVASLLNQGADANIANENGQIPLHLHRGRADIAELLVEHTKNINEKDRYGATALIRAAGHKANSELIRILLDHGATVNVCDKQGNTPLHMALYEGDEETAKMLIFAGANIDAINNEKQSCLSIAPPVMQRRLRAIKEP